MAKTAAAELELDHLALARNVILTEIEALQAMAGRLDANFSEAVAMVLGGRGRVVVLGMGKSGIVGRKIAATLASTGTPAYFVHPGEAFHGDLGMIAPDDIALMVSNGGETEELLRLLPFLAHQKNGVVAMTGNQQSTLARHADVVLDVAVAREACNNNLAPTSSTTAALVMGDALAVVLSTLRGFQPEDFARFHPGGSLGRKLLATVADVMHRGTLPLCRVDASFREVVHIVTRGRLGLAIAMEGNVLRGIITDGDIRRAFDRTDEPTRLTAGDFMTSNPKTARVNERFAEAEQRMLEAKVNSLIVLEEPGEVVGVIQIYGMAGLPAEN